MKILYYVSSLFQPFGKAFESTLNQGLKSFDGAFKGVRQMIGGKSGARGSVRHEGAGGKSLSRPTASKSRPKNSGFPDFQDFRPPKDFGVRILTFTSSDNLQT